jgi:MtN3 and saliva related transmembrane protein
MVATPALLLQRSERGPRPSAPSRLAEGSVVSSTVLGVAAGTWGVVMAVSPLLQIRRIVRLQSSEDVSIGYLAVLVVGFSLWIAYGLAIADAALIVPNCVALVVGITTICVALRFRRTS